MDLELLRATLLCLGAKPTADAAESLRRNGMTPGFIHGVVLELPNGRPVNTRVLDSAPPLAGLPLLYLRDGAPWVDYEDGSVPVTYLPSGAAMLTRSSEMFGLAGIDRFSLHSARTLFCSPIDQCIFGVLGSPCTFCTYEMAGPVRRLPPDSYARVLAHIAVERPELSAVAIGGATPNLHDSGAGYYAELATCTQIHGLKSSVELVPPPVLHRLDPLLESGVGALIMSIEIWDERTRAQVCLGKGEVTKGHYRQAWRKALRSLGPGSVSSVLLVGLEPLESTRRGAMTMIADGVIPTLIPFRRYEGMAGQPHSVAFSPAEYLALTEEIRRELRGAGLDPAHQAGCAACGGCSMEAGPEASTRSGVPPERRRPAITIMSEAAGVPVPSVERRPRSFLPRP